MRSAAMRSAAAREEATFWCAADLGDLELLRARYVTHVYARHTHEGFAIGVIEAGAESFYYRHANHTAPAGHIVLVNPGEVHTGQAATENGWTYRMFYPSADLLQQIASEVARRPRGIPYFPEAVVRDDAMAVLLRHLHVTLADPASALERASRLTTTFAHLIQRHAGAPPDLPDTPRLGAERAPAARVREYIHAHLAENVTLDQLARVANLSPFHLLRVFQREAGLPPHAYQTQLRVARAKSLLALGLSPAQVALDTGFADQSHLTRHFKRLVGVAPGRYAASWRSSAHAREPASYLTADVR